MIDTANKRRNVSRITTTILLIQGLVPTNGVDGDDRENADRAYIGFSYAPPAPPASGIYSRIHQGTGLSF